jgi:hypothetical protein
LINANANDPFTDPLGDWSSGADGAMRGGPACRAALVIAEIPFSALFVMRRVRSWHLVSSRLIVRVYLPLDKYIVHRYSHQCTCLSRFRHVCPSPPTLVRRLLSAG